MPASSATTALPEPPALPSPSRPVPLHVRLLWLPEAMPGMLFGALDVLRTAAAVARLQRPDADRDLSWTVIGASGRALALPALGLEPARRRRATEDGNALVVVPGVLTRNAPHLGEIVAGAGHDLAQVWRIAREHARHHHQRIAVFRGAPPPRRLQPQGGQGQRAARRADHGPAQVAVRIRALQPGHCRRGAQHIQRAEQHAGHGLGQPQQAHVQRHGAARRGKGGRLRQGGSGRRGGHGGIGIPIGGIDPTLPRPQGLASSLGGPPP